VRILRTDNFHRVALEQSETLLKKARTIFGPSVEVAWICARYFESDHARIVRALAERNNDMTDSGRIDLEDGDIRLQFTGGKVVAFSCSEWGAIEAVSNEDWKEKAPESLERY
jgi:hypothetical protein